MSVCFISPYTLFYNYSNTGAYRGLHYFLIFALKHILWVLVLTASKRVPTIYVLSKNMKLVKHFQLKIVIFTAVKNRCILHGRVFVMRSKDEDSAQTMCCVTVEDPWTAKQHQWKSKANEEHRLSPSRLSHH